MTNEPLTRKILLVDDENEFRRATAATLGRRGFEVIQAASGREAVAAVRCGCPELVVLDLKMPQMGGIETLQKIREIDASLPVIILTGHGDFEAAVAGIKLAVVDFLQKPVDIDQLAARIRAFLEAGDREPLRERTIAEIMVSPVIYPKVRVDDPASAVLAALKRAFHQPVIEGVQPGQVRSTLVYDKNDKFLGIIRFNDLLRLLVPPFLSESPYASFFTGMFLAQCKVFGNRETIDLIVDQVVVDVDAPLMEAVHLMVKHRLINLPVVKDGELVGVLRGRDIVLEVAGSLGSL